jgi:hypothetical protein
MLGIELGAGVKSVCEIAPFSSGSQRLKWMIKTKKGPKAQETGFRKAKEPAWLEGLKRGNTVWITLKIFPKAKKEPYLAGCQMG